MAVPGTDTGEKTRAVLGLLWIQYVLIAAYEVTPSSVLTVVAPDLDIGITAAGAIVSVLFLGMALFAVPSGILVDRFDNYQLLPWLGSGFIAVGVAGWYAGEQGLYWLLLATRVLGGGVAVANWTVSVDMVSVRVDSSRQATAIGLFAAAIPVGLAVGQSVVPMSTQLLGWPSSFLLFGGGAGIIMLGIRFVSFPQVRRHADAEPATPSTAQIVAVFESRGVWTVSILAFVGLSLLFFVNNWMPSYLIDRYGVTIAQGGLLTAIFPAIGVLARAGSGVISDRFLEQRRRPVVLLSFLITAPAILGFVVVDSVGFAVVLLLVGGFFSQIGGVILFTYVRDIVAPNVVGTALAVLNTMAFIGAFLTPLLTGALIEGFGYESAFVYTGVLALLGVILAWYAPSVQ